MDVAFGRMYLNQLVVFVFTRRQRQTDKSRSKSGVIVYLLKTGFSLLTGIRAA